MIANFAPVDSLPAVGPSYVVSFGKSGALGCFTADAGLILSRGMAVVIETLRGLEVGSVVGPASQNGKPSCWEARVDDVCCGFCPPPMPSSGKSGTIAPRQFLNRPVFSRIEANCRWG